MTRTSKTDSEWEAWGATNPYFGVLTDPRFSSSALDATLKNQFFATGRDHVAGLMDALLLLDPSFKPSHVVDFGCGVGRVAIPFAQVSDEVTGLDISPSMIAEATANANERGVVNLHLHVDDDRLAHLPESYNLVHSALVFQHISPARGYAITAHLLAGLQGRGAAAIQYIAHDATRQPMRTLRQLRRRSSLANGAANLLRGRRFSTPNVQMNTYDLGRLLSLFFHAGIDRGYLSWNHDDADYLSVTIIGIKR